MLPFFASTLQASSPATPLQRRQTFQLRARRGERIDCRTGQLWITQDGDPRDVVLRAGESFDLDRGTPTIVQALETATVLILDPVVPPHRTMAQRARRVAAALRRFATPTGDGRHRLATVDR